jgi:hypothetical protein
MKIVLTIGDRLVLNGDSDEILIVISFFNVASTLEHIPIHAIRVSVFYSAKMGALLQKIYRKIRC